MGTTTINQRLKEKREAANLTQGRLAELAGLSRVSINQYENQGITPHLNNRCAIARVLDCAVEELWP